MVSELGKFLRKLRIDCGEVLFDMAEKLGVSSSFLSAVENGKKRMPSRWNEILPDIYSFSVEKRKTFTNAVAASENGIEIDFRDMGMERRRLGVALAREIRTLPQEKMSQLRRMLMEPTSSKDAVTGKGGKR